MVPHLHSLGIDIGIQKPAAVQEPMPEWLNPVDGLCGEAEFEADYLGERTSFTSRSRDHMA